MATDQTFVIVGAALAGASAAGELREQGFDGRIVLIGAEKRYPYIRPPLSKGFLAGKDPISDAYVHVESWYDEKNIDFRPGSVVASIDREASEVVLEDGERVGYDRLLLATGSSPRTLDLPGSDLEGVHSLRTLDDSEWLRTQLKDGGRRLTLIGSGWIGLEVAATAKQLGNEVTVLEHVHVPLSSAIGDELGQLFVDLHAEHGVVIKTGVDVLEISGIDGKVAGVKVGGIQIVRSDLVLVAVGAAPNVSLAEEAGLDVDNGITVDSSLRTSDPRIFAAGDVANAWHPVAQLSLRSEHWANALNQGKAAARSMLGLEESYDEIPYFYTDQYDLGMEYSGYGPLAAGAQLVYRGSREERKFIVFWVADGKVVAGMNVNVWDVNDDIQGIIRRGNMVDVAALANPEVALDSL